MLDEAAALALAPDEAGRKAGRSLAVPGLWEGAGRADDAAWGRVRGSGRTPYRVAVDASTRPAWSCACPSRKQPCKHAVALLLLLARGQLAPGSPPPEVVEWLDGRAERAAKAAAKQARASAGEVADPAAQEKRRQRREANVAAGITDLERWLDDLVRGGLVAAQSRSWTSWDEAGARLVDAQAPGLAGRVRALGRAAHSGPGWPERVLAQLGRLHLVLEGWRHLPDLPPALAAEVRTQIGFPTAKAEVLAGPAVRDRWDVLASIVSDDGTLATRRVWLRGRTVGGWALLLDTGPSGASFDTERAVGTTIEADVHRYPGVAGQRALVGEQHGEPVPINELEGATVDDVLAADALALAASPWLPQSPACLGSVVPVVDGDRWLLVDEGGDALPLTGPAWDLVALSGGHPVAVVGEWDGHRLLPLACYAENGLWPLGMAS